MKKVKDKLDQNMDRSPETQQSEEETSFQRVRKLLNKVESGLKECDDFTDPEVIMHPLLPALQDFLEHAQVNDLILLEEVFQEALRIAGINTNVFAENVDKSDLVLATEKLKQQIETNALPKSFTVREIYKRRWRHLKSKEIVTAACHEMVNVGYLKRQGLWYERVK